MIVEGKNAVRELINSGATINKFYVEKGLKDKQSNEIISLAKSKNIHVDFVSKEVIDKKSVSKRHQGFLCETVNYEYCGIDDILNEAHKRQEPPFIVVLDKIEDPHNLGAIIRTCECAGVHGIVIPKHRACQVNDTVLKTSVGAAINMKIASVTNINNTIEYLKNNNIWIYGLELGGKDIFTANLKGAIALVVGSEGYGISRLTKEKCDEIISLKQNGKVNSLNASVACGIAVYEILKQR